MKQFKIADKIQDRHTKEVYAVINPEVDYKNGKKGARVKKLGGGTMILSESKTELCDVVN